MEMKFYHKLLSELESVFKDLIEAYYVAVACILLLKIIIIASPLKILIGTAVQGILSDDILACSGYLHKVKKWYALIGMPRS